MTQPATMAVFGYCDDCPFWGHDEELERRSGKAKGECRADPPKGGAGWPRTDGKDWCGRHPLRDAHWRMKAAQCLDALQRPAPGAPPSPAPGEAVQ